MLCLMAHQIYKGAQVYCTLQKCTSIENNNYVTFSSVSYNHRHNNVFYRNDFQLQHILNAIVQKLSRTNI